ncbi:MAG: HipA domain-containing protein [Fimbriimonadaceae bacterium]|nr:HipA domain-containing protein [Fimbriimonadaceae bacterium]
MLRSTEIERVSIYCDGVLCGELRRTPKGSAFQYDRAFLTREEKPLRGIAVHLPYRESPYITQGVNLHTFFAGLLPEGLRLEAIIAKARTSRDDLFSLFVEAGPDSVGDVYGVPAGQTVDPDIATVDLAKIQGAGFDELEEGFVSGARDASIPGVQAKLSAGRINQPIGSTQSFGPSILKLAPRSYPRLVENEYFFLNLGAKCGMAVPKVEIVHDRRDRSGLIVWRFDRDEDLASGTIRRIHQEDACQLANRYSADKYRLTMREIAEAICEHCDTPAVSLYKLAKLCIFSYLIGNGDLHAKNISVFRRKQNGPLTLTPAYDLVSTLAYPDLDTRMALQLDGKDDNIKKRDFAAFFERHGLKASIVESEVEQIANGVGAALTDLPEIGLDEKTTARMTRIMQERIARL